MMIPLAMLAQLWLVTETDGQTKDHSIYCTNRVLCCRKNRNA